MVKPMRGMAPNEQIIADAKPEIAHHLKVIEQALPDNPNFAGSDLSLADLFVAPIRAYSETTPEGEEIMLPLLATNAWLNRIQNLNNFHKINAVG